MSIFLYHKHFSPRGDQFRGGTLKSIHGFAKGLTACGADVAILCEGSDRSSFQTKDGYVIECFCNSKRGRTFKLSAQLKEYIYDTIETSSIVVINGLFSPDVYAMSRVLRKRKLPYIMAPRSVYHPLIFRKRPHIKWPYWYLFEKRMLRQAKALQLQDTRQTVWLRCLGVETPVIEVPNGVLPAQAPPESSLRWSDIEVPKLLCFGRVDAHHKGLDILIDACLQIAEWREISLTIQGPDAGDKTRLCKQITNRLGAKKITFANADYDTPPTQIISNYDIVCVPSRYEGFSNTTLEAMLAGRVLLITESTGSAPQVQQSGCGVLVEPTVPSIFAGLKELLVKRSQWRQMGLQGRRHVLEKLDWQKIASMALREYESLAD